MAFELPSIQTLESLWNWAKNSIEIWCRAMGSLSDVVFRSDPDQYNTLVEAVQFSLFPVALSILIEIPYNVMWSAGKYGATGVITDFVSDYMFIVFAACSQKISSIVVRGHGSLRASFTLALFGIAYLPVMSILGYVIIPGKDEISLFISLINLEISRNFLELGYNILNRYGLHILAFALTTALFAIFLIIRFVPATAYIHKVGRVRALIICMLTLLFCSVSVVFVLGPLSNRLLTLG
jgi:hypothetical protein